MQLHKLASLMQMSALYKPMHSCKYYPVLYITLTLHLHQIHYNSNTTTLFIYSTLYKVVQGLHRLEQGWKSTKCIWDRVK